MSVCKHFAPTLTLLALTIFGASSSSVAEEPETEQEPFRVWIDDEPEPQPDVFQFVLDTNVDSDIFFVQDEGDVETPPPVTPPTRTRSQIVAARRRRSTYRLPSMFGDHFGGGIRGINTQGTPIVINQSFRDGDPGFDSFVTNRNGNNGADVNPAVTIDLFNGGPSGTMIAWSSGPGVPQSGTIAYPISDPTVGGFSPPIVHGPGNLTYTGGTVTYFGAGNPIGDGENWGLDFSHTFTPFHMHIPVPAGGAAVRRVKVAENNSPLPRDRFIANYNFFNDVIGGIGDVNRYTFGFERTMLGESSSVQFLFPFASTLAADQVAGGALSKNTEFGDVSLQFKTLLVERDEYALAGGLGMTVPTGSDARVFNTLGDKIIHVDHEAVHLLPYVALVRGYDSGWYWQSFLQLDIDVNGNGIRADATATNLQPVGVLQEQTLLFADLGVGYQFNDPEEDGLPSVAAIAELHYTTTLQDADAISAGALNIESLTNRFDVLNLTLGMNILTNHGFSIRPAMVIPLRDGHDEQFDYEAMVQMNFWR